MSQAAALASATGGGAGNNNNATGGSGLLPSFMSGGIGDATRAVMNQAMNRNKATASATARAGARGLGGGMGKRIGSIESRLDALEKPDGDAVQSVQPIQKFVQGGSFSEIPSTPPPAPVAPGTLNASQSPGSLQEAMPSPGDPAADMFGSEFMRNASVGAAKMRMNKKI
jgi:hypothetical protein